MWLKILNIDSSCLNLHKIAVEEDKTQIPFFGGGENGGFVCFALPDGKLLL